MHRLHSILHTLTKTQLLYNVYSDITCGISNSYNVIYMQYNEIQKQHVLQFLDIINSWQIFSYGKKYTNKYFLAKKKPKKPTSVTPFLFNLFFFLFLGSSKYLGVLPSTNKHTLIFFVCSSLFFLSHGFNTVCNEQIYLCFAWV